MKVKIISNLYRCPLCKKVVIRESNKQWIKSMCGESGNKITRLIKIKDDKNISN